MNIYARYFDQDTIAYSFDELLDFLTSIPEIPINQRMVDDLRAYVESDMPYPKRYKIRPRVYFILIKTDAANMEEFKARHKANATQNNYTPQPQQTGELSLVHRKELRMAELTAEEEGWYEGTVTFKRVIQIPETAKFCYQDTTFSALVKANSGFECYTRIIDHLRNRVDVDQRSQFPSVKGNSYNFRYVGKEINPADYARETANGNIWFTTLRSISNTIISNYALLRKNNSVTLQRIFKENGSVAQ